MFGLGKNKLKHDELETLVQKIEINMGNNYKDASKEAFRKFEKRYQELLSSKKLSAKQESYYEQLIEDYRKELKNFSHK